MSPKTNIKGCIPTNLFCIYATHIAGSAPDLMRSFPCPFLREQTCAS